MIKVVLFDLDDTLIPERDFAFSAFEEISIYLESILKFKSDELLNDMKELYKIEPRYIFDRLFLLHDTFLEDKLKNDLISIYRNHYPKLNLSYEVLNVLEALKAKGYKLGIITDGFHQSQRNKLEVLRLDQFVDKIIITDEIGREFWKPNPKAFQMMRDYFDVKFSEMIYVGDNPDKDFIAPNTLMMKSAYIIREQSTYYSSNPNSKSTYRITSLADLLNILN